MNITERIAEKIRELRNRKGLSQADLASEFKIATNTVSRWETGTYKPGVEDLQKLATFFDVSIIEFIPEENLKGSDRLNALLRSANGLPDEDIDELRRYAEYRRVRSSLK